MYIFQFLVGMQFYAGFMIPFYLDWGKLSFAQVTYLQSFYVFAVFILEIPTGTISDYFGRKTSLIFTALTISIGYIIYCAPNPTFYTFLLAEFAFAIGFSLLSGADQALIYDSLKQEKNEKESKKIFGKFNSFKLIGLMIAAPLGSAIASKIGFRYAALLTIIPFFFAFLIACFFTEPKTKFTKEKALFFKTLKSGIHYFATHKALKILAFDMISINTLAIFIIWTHQLILKQLNFPLIYFGFVFTLLMGSQTLLLHNFEKLEKIFKSKKNYLLWSAIIPGISFLILGLNNNITLAIILISLIAGFGLSRRTLLQSYMNKHIDSHNRSTVLSSISMLQNLAKGIFYPLVGLLATWSVNYTMIILGLLTIIFALFSRVTEEHLID